MIFHKIEHNFDEQLLSAQTLLGYDVLKSSSDEGTKNLWKIGGMFEEMIILNSYKCSLFGSDFEYRFGKFIIYNLW